MNDTQNNNQNTDNLSYEERAKMAQEFHKQVNEQLENLSKIDDFKEYFKLQRDIVKKYIGTWPYIEKSLERDSVEDYKLLLKSFFQKAEEDNKNNKIDSAKFEVIKKFNEQINSTLEKKDFQKTSEQLFYVLLGNVLEHIGKVNIDMKKFDIQKDLYPNLQMPLGLTFFLFQNLTFGPISKKVNDLSQEYLQKYCALLLGLWRTVFELMQYEKNIKKTKPEENKK